MKQLRADRGALGDGIAVINEGPDAYVMEDNRIRLEPGEALACVAVPEFGPMNSAFLYRMSREEAEAWVHNRSTPPHRNPDDDKARRLYRAYTHGTGHRAPISWIEEDAQFTTVDDKILAYMKHSEIGKLRDHYRFSSRTNFIGHLVR